MKLSIGDFERLEDMKEDNNNNTNVSGSFSYSYHELSTLFPLLETDKLSELADDIKTNGLQQPIVIYNNQILDGRNRFEACKLANVTPTYTNYTGSNAISYVMSVNFHRRHLTATQKATVAVKLLPELEKQAKLRKKASLLVSRGVQYGADKITGTISEATVSKGEAVVHASKIANVSKTYIQQASKIQEESPYLFLQMERGEKTLKEAKNEMYKRKEAELKDTKFVQIPSISTRYSLHNTDILAAPIEDNSLDVVITDPPYPYEYIECWSKLAEFASKKLKEGGVLLAMSGQLYLPEVYQRMNVPGLNYYWTMCVKNTVSTDLWTVRSKTQWKPILWYIKGKYTRTYQPTDVFCPVYTDTKTGQEHHKWGQSLPLFEELVEQFSYANETICDPFLGGGTTGIAALNLKRKFIGIEVDKTVFTSTSERIANESK